MANVQRGYLDLSEVKSIEASEDDIQELQLEPGDVLFTEGGDRDKLGRGWVWNGELSECIHQNHIFRARLLSSDLLPKLVSHWGNSFGQRWFMRVGRQSVNLASINLSILRRFPIPVPPSAEQTRIADALDELFSDLDAGVAALERARGKLRQYRAAVVKAAVEGALTEAWRKQHPATEPASVLLDRILAERRQRWEETQLRKFREAGKTPPEDWKAKYPEPVVPDTTSLPKLPEGWCWASVEQLASPEPNSLTDGPFGSNLMTSHYTSSGPRVIRLQNIKDGTFSDERAYISEDHFERLKKHQIEAGNIVIAALSENPPRACIIPESVGPAIVKADCVRFKPHPSLFAKVLCYFLISLPTRIRTKQIVHGVGRPRLNLGEIRSIVIPLAPLAEQAAIVEAVEDQLSVIEHLEADLEAKRKSAQALRQSILRHAFEGRLVPQNPDDEPASELLKRIAAARAEREMPARSRKNRTKQDHQPELGLADS